MRPAIVIVMGVEQFLFAIIQNVFLRQRHSRAERWAARNDRDLVQRMCVIE